MGDDRTIAQGGDCPPGLRSALRKPLRGARAVLSEQLLMDCETELRARDAAPASGDKPLPESPNVAPYNAEPTCPKCDGKKIDQTDYE